MGKEAHYRNMFLLEVGVEVKAVANGVQYGAEHVEHVSLLIDDRKKKGRAEIKEGSVRE